MPQKIVTALSVRRLVDGSGLAITFASLLLCAPSAEFTLSIAERAQGAALRLCGYSAKQSQIPARGRKH